MAEVSALALARSHRRRAVGLALLSVVCAVFVAGGCAKPGPPGGGPVDTEPPLVVDTRPPDESVGVDADARVEIEFSEEMDRPSVERWLSSTPEIKFAGFKWRGKTLIAEPAQPLPDSTTVVVGLGSQAQDYHGVLMGVPYSFAFSTGDVLDRGLIAGTVTVGGDPAPSATVWACVEGAEPDTARLIQPCGYSTSADGGGAFRFRNVATSRRPYTIVAFSDANADRRYWVDGESGVVMEDAALVDSEGDSVVGLTVPIEPPEPPGTSQETGTVEPEAEADTLEADSPPAPDESEGTE